MFGRKSHSLLKILTGQVLTITPKVSQQGETHTCKYTEQRNAPLIGHRVASLQSTCFFLGPARSWFEALHTIFRVVDPVTSFLKAVALSATFPDILARCPLLLALAG